MLALWVTLASAVAAQPGGAKTTLVVGTDAPALSAELRASLSSVAAAEAKRRLLGRTVFSSGDVAMAVGMERQRALLGCTGDSECLTELAGSLDADEVIATRVTRVNAGPFSSEWLVDARRLEARSGKVLATGQARVCGGESLLARAVEGSVAHALGVGAVVVPGECRARGTALAMTGGGVALVAIAALGVGYGASVKHDFDVQQDPATVATVTRAQAGIAANVLWGALGVGAAGLALAGLGVAGLTEDSGVKVALLPGPQGAAFVVGGSF